MNVKKMIGKLGKKNIDVKNDKDEYVKSIIYLYIYFVKKIGINNNYVTNDMAMRWHSRSSEAINTMFQLLVIYRYL